MLVNFWLLFQVCVELFLYLVVIYFTLKLLVLFFDKNEANLYFLFENFLNSRFFKDIVIFGIFGFLISCFAIDIRILLLRN